MRERSTCGIESDLRTKRPERQMARRIDAQQRVVHSESVDDVRCRASLERDAASEVGKQRREDRASAARRLSGAGAVARRSWSRESCCAVSEPWRGCSTSVEAAPTAGALARTDETAQQASSAPSSVPPASLAPSVVGFTPFYAQRACESTRKAAARGGERRSEEKHGAQRRRATLAGCEGTRAARAPARLARHALRAAWT